MHIDNCSNITIKNNTFFGKQCNKQATNKKSNDKDFSKSLLVASEIGLAVMGMTAVVITAKKICSQGKIVNKLKEELPNGSVFCAKNKSSNNIISKTNSLNEKFNIEIKDGKIQQSTKILPNGSVSWVKKYSQNKYGHRIVEIFVPDKNNGLKLERKIETSKDKIAVFKGENTIEKYWYKTPFGWKRIEDCIDKSDIKNRMTPEDYYEYNGIQINAFLRDGDFRNPDIRKDKINYEILNNPKCPEFAKEEIRNIMRDNRFILLAIDDLDILTQKSKTKEPMVVYRNAPFWWINKAKNGILYEPAFCSTSTVKGASMEGLYLGKDAKSGITYTIYLPAGTNFYDLRHTNEKEMLLPRKGYFKVINETELEYLIQ